MSILAFDVELDKLVPPYDGNVSWELPNKPKVTCAATCEVETGRTKIYWSPANDGKRLASEKLSQFTLCELIDDLYNHVCRGGLIVSWGGTAVDFRALHASCTDTARKQICIYLAKTQIDIPFASSSDLGCMFSLNSAAKAMGLSGKDSLISSAAPQLWENGSELEVLSHVQGDAILTANIYSRALDPKFNPYPKVTWITKRGKMKTWKPTIISVKIPMTNYNGQKDVFIQTRFQTVQECMLKPKPSVPYVTPHGLDRDYAVKWIDVVSK
jgi:hypothetical protein